MNSNSNMKKKDIIAVMNRAHSLLLDGAQIKVTIAKHNNSDIHNKFDQSELFYPEQKFNAYFQAYALPEVPPTKKKSKKTLTASEQAVKFLSNLQANEANLTYPLTSLSVPDEEEYQFDVQNNHYFNPTTNYFYLPSSGYFYDSIAQQYLYFDPASRQYIKYQGNVSDSCVSFFLSSFLPLLAPWLIRRMPFIQTVGNQTQQNTSS